MRIFNISVLIVLLYCANAHALEATVIKVADGDTITVLHNGKKMRVRLYGIDAPELPGDNKRGQAYSKRSRDLTISLVLGKQVSIVEMGFDKYARTVAGVISLPDGKVVQEELLKAGLAWVYPAYCHDCRQWKELEAEARRNKKGLWQSANPIAPWKWRHPERKD